MQFIGNSVLVGHRFVSETKSKYIGKDSYLNKNLIEVFLTWSPFLSVITTFKIPIDIINNESESKVNFSKISKI